MLLHIWTVLYICTAYVYANTETFQVILPSAVNNTQYNNVSIDKIIDMETYQRDQSYTINIHNNKSIVIQIINLPPQPSKYSFKLCWTAIDSIDLSPNTFTILPNSIISFQMMGKSYSKDIPLGEYHINVSLTKIHLGFIPDELIPTLLTIISILFISILSIFLYKNSSPST